MILADGSTVTLNANTKILDADNCATGSDKQLPPQELFSRIGTERYTKATYTYQPVDENGNPKVDANGNPVTETKDTGSAGKGKKNTEKVEEGGE